MFDGSFSFFICFSSLQNFGGASSLRLDPRPLPPPKDTVHSVTKRRSGALRELYSSQERMQLLSCGPTAASGHATKIRIAILCWAKDCFCFFIASTADGTTIRDAWAAALSSTGDATTHETTRTRKLYP
jgi:hypothetical protein